MTEIKAISIPEPCHQSWQQMTSVDNGRHCANCCKTVVDFTKMSNEEIVKHLSHRDNLCGRFEPQQLNSINYKLYSESLSVASWWKRVAVIVGMLGPLALKVSGQTKPVIVNAMDTLRSENKTEKNDFVKGKVAVINSRLIKGVVTAKDDGLPIPGVTIKVKGINGSIVTNAAGVFALSIPANGATLEVSFIGYTMQTVTINNIVAVEPFHIVLNPTQVWMGEVVITKPIVKRPKNL